MACSLSGVNVVFERFGIFRQREHDAVDGDQCDESRGVANGLAQADHDKLSKEKSPDKGSDNVVEIGRSEQAEIGRKLRTLYDKLKDEELPPEIDRLLTELRRKLEPPRES
jgi:hypothetical protein